VNVQAADPSKLFADDSVIEIELTGPFNRVFKDVKTRDRHAMELRVGGRTLNIDVSVRGKSRVEVCEFPPLRLYFAGDTDGTPFNAHHSLKVVTHCFNSDKGERNLIDEYAAYRAFGVLTKLSYRTRLVRIRYVSTDGPLPVGASPRAAFFIEPRAEFAARVGGQAADLAGVRLSELEQQHAATVFVFQYLIGNTDWSLVMAKDDDKCCHNVDLVRVDGQLVVIPYDFDLSGIVDAPYAEPDPSLRLRRVTTRRYRGYCVDPDALRMAISEIIDRQDEIAAELSQIPIATDEHIFEMLDYLERFFETAEDQEKMLRSFSKRCLQ
jgi:hypothetical protein